MNLTDFQNSQDIHGALAQRRIAVVGLSAKPHRDSYGVAQYLLAHGYEVIPVNPQEREILGQTCYATLADIPGSVDVVDVFRASDAVPAITQQAIAVGAKYLWLQLGVIHEEAARQAQQAGLGVVMDRCIKIDHAQLPAASS